MQFNRSSQHDERRRRMLTDESLQQTPAESRPSSRRDSPAAKSQRGRNGARYGQKHFIAAGPKITDLVPQNYGAIALWFLAGLTVIALLELLYAWMADLAAMTTDGRVAAFDLDGEGSLAVWFSAAALAMAAALSWLIYGLRRHKEDDYNGRYRIWIWAGLCWLVMSIDEAGSLHEGFKELMAAATGWRLSGDGSLWWVLAYSLVLGVIGFRLLLEMRVCRASTTAMILTACSYAVAVATQLGWILPASGARGVMVEEGCEMMGNLLLLLGVALHARFVILESQGTQAVPRKRRATEKKKTETAPKESTRTAPKKSQPTRSAATARSQSTASPPKREKKRRAMAEDYAESDDEPRSRRSSAETVRIDPAHPASKKRKLSKADRKALRKQKRREQEEHEY